MGAASGWTRTRLPIAVAPLPGEAFDSWIEAYARRLRTSPADLLTLARLPKEGHGRLFPNHTVMLNDSEAGLLTDLTGIPADHLHELTLRRFDGHALTLNPQYRSLARVDRWGMITGSRYCPACLTEQPRYWALTWRLSWTFACTRHQTLLRDHCPTCARRPRRIIAPGGVTDPATCFTLIGPQRRRCGTDLSRPVSASPPSTDHKVTDGMAAILAAQDQINILLAAAGTADHQAAARHFTDLRGVTRWLLKHHVPEDFADFGADTVTAWQNFAAATAGTRFGTYIAPPTAVLMASLTTTALQITRPGSDNGQTSTLNTTRRLAALLARAPRRGQRRHPRPAGMPKPYWTQMSQPVQARFLNVMDREFITGCRIRFRTCTPLARLADTTPAAQSRRAARIPQLLWPDWTIRLMPTQNLLSDHFRNAISICLLLPGHPHHKITQIAEETGLEPHRRFNVAVTLRELASSPGNEAVLAAICLLADYLDTHTISIDYKRRRLLIPDTPITLQQWRQLCFQAGTHPGEARRHLEAGRYLYQLLTGADLTDPRHALAFTAHGDRSKQATFSLTLPTQLRTALHTHAAGLLHSLGIDEPVTWHPPARICAHLDLPGTDPDSIDLHAVHQLIVNDGLPVTTVAEQLGTSVDHIRLAAERIPQPSPHRRDWGHPHNGRALFTRDFFEREYIQAGKRVRQIAAETGYSRKFIAECARDAGITLAKAREPAHHIDQHWLREQYLDRKRSFLDIGAELGLDDMAVIRIARRYGIPARPSGVTSRPEMIKTLDADIHPDIRRAVEGKLHGWQRLHRFQTAMAHPTLTTAAVHLGIFQGALTKQLQRLEQDIGAQLFHRATTKGGTLRPTRRGTDLLHALDQPPIRTLLDFHNPATPASPEPDNQ
jgi:hypothetical protein